MSETTLVAVRGDTGERVVISDVPAETLRQLSDAHLLRCPHCNSLLTFKAGPVRIHHFAHVSLDNCSSIDHEPESDSHRQGKMLLYTHFRQAASIGTIEQHLSATDQRADVFMQMPDGLQYALEFQQANNSVERWSERHRMYRSINIHDIWFLGQIRYQERQSDPPRPISPYDPLPVPRKEFEAASGSFNARELEKAIFAITPQLYYLDPETELLTILLVRSLTGNTMRAYRYRLSLTECVLRDGFLWTPLEPLLQEYHQYLIERGK